MLRILSIILLLCLSLPATARMYQWVDPESGTTQLSGKPPVWYRSDEGGPRVFVFENGQVVDDTGVEVSDIEKDRLRQQALIRAEQDREKAREKLMDAKRIKALVDKDREGREEQVEEVVDYEPEPAGREEPAREESGEQEQEQEQTAEAMRELIREWERMQTEQARDVIGTERSAPPTDIAPPPPSDM